MGSLFRGKILAGLRTLYEQGDLDLTGPCALLRERDTFRQFLDRWYKKRWQVYCKPPFGDTESVFAYLGCYAHWVGISNARPRHFGILASGNVNTKLAEARQLLDGRRKPDVTLQEEPRQPADGKSNTPGYVLLYKQLTGIDLECCPKCGGSSTSNVALQTKARAPP